MVKLQTTLFLLTLSFYHVLSVKIKLKQGNLEGTENVSRAGRKFYSFLGIPFAKPPVGDLRFQSPQPHPGWSGILDASSEGNMCMQNMFETPHSAATSVGSEDCLYINVHTHRPCPSKKNPVMVYIYGGAYQIGDSGLKTYGPYYLMDRDIVYVSFNYRLGIFGFLSFEDERLPGNFGLKDQLLALKWVKDNIKSFGGDPNSITIFGDSAGASSVHYHLLSPKSEGLFHKASIQSGSAFCPWAVIPHGISKARAEAVATLLGCFGNLNETIPCLKKVAPEEVLSTQLKFIHWAIDPIISFSPVIEVSHQDAFITKHPYLYKTNPNIPIIIGINQNEGALRTARLCSDNFLELKELNKSWDSLVHISTLIRDSVALKDLPAVTKSLKSFYLEDQDATESNIKSLTDMYSDLLINYCTVKAAKHASGPVYFYLYGYESQVSWTSVFGNCSIPLGVCHADELNNFFNLNSLFGDFQLEGKHLEMSEILVQVWTNFAKSGVPTDDKKQITWRTFNAKSEGGNYLHIGDHTFIMESNILKDRLEFVQSLPLQYNVDFLPTRNPKDEL